jgi:gamma-glutamylcyclotransferase (GGCT)/AIG2-like uncharacterized protein YtfP
MLLERSTVAKRVFVYGTLRRGQRAHNALKDCRFVEERRVPGFDMYNLFGFPGVKANPDNKNGIVGEVFEVDNNTLSLLDYYEGYNPERHGGHYLREQIEVSGEPTDIYVYNHDVDPFEKVASGNWATHREL